MKRPKSGGSEHLTAPLLVMNNFNSPPVDETSTEKQAPRVPKHLESLATSVFQSLFPPINPTATPLKGIKRVLLADRVRDTDAPSDAATYILNLRHYAIETRTAKSVPKALRRLDAAEKLTHAGQKRKRGGLPNLGGLKDVSDYLLDPHAADGFTSGSDSEPDTDAEVEIAASIARKVSKRKSAKESNNGEKRDSKANVERKAIKLHELGPRLKLRLTKVEEGVCAGKVMWHEYIHKSKEEIREMEKYHEQRRREKEARKAEQKANVEKKKAERRARGEAVDDEEDEDEDFDDGDDDQWDDEDGLEADEGGEDEEMVDAEEEDDEEED
jgi:ribosome biogenesis protein SSF1/2